MANTIQLKNRNSIFSSHALRNIESFKLYYDRRLPAGELPKGLSSYLEGTQHFYLKQAPSATLIKRPGVKFPASLVKDLRYDGLFNKDEDAPIGDLSNTLPEYQEGEDAMESISSQSTAEAMPQTVKYEDPWRIMAAWAYSSHYKLTTSKINVWSGGCHRLQDKIRPQWCGSDSKNDTSFIQISDHCERMYLLMKHTHWGFALQEARRSLRFKDRAHRSKFGNFANTLHKRIGAFLRGLPDPIWTDEETEKFCHYGLTKTKSGTREYASRRDIPYRSKRFIEVLKTVDGMFSQRFLSYPEEVWTWNKYDLFVLQSISILITDEFIDGEFTAVAMDHYKTYYEELKSSRKRAKVLLHREDPAAHFEKFIEEQPRWVSSFFGKAWKYATRHTGVQLHYLAGVMSQTRESGTPPPIVVVKSKRKFLRTISEVSPSYTATQKALVNRALENVIRRITDSAFTGLNTKALVTVTGAACIEEGRKRAGTAQAILELMSKYDDTPIPVIDLDTGQIKEHLMKKEFDAVGTAVFNACLNEVLQTKPEVLRTVHLTIFKEPGKARSVTKGMAALKIVLDTVSKICSWPLKKGVKSSESEMGRAHHGWNLFKDFPSNEMKDLIFWIESSMIERDFADYLIKDVTWKDVFLLSTDYQEATDRLVHKLASHIASVWMNRCGIPRLLQEIVLGTCFEERTVLFAATGELTKEGTCVEGDLYKTTLHRGVLTEDPLTKVILHLVNVVTREIGSGLTSGSTFKGIPNGEEAFELFKKSLNSPSELSDNSVGAVLRYSQ